MKSSELNCDLNYHIFIVTTLLFLSFFAVCFHSDSCPGQFSKTLPFMVIPTHLFCTLCTVCSYAAESVCYYHYKKSWICVSSTAHVLQISCYVLAFIMNYICATSYHIFSMYTLECK